MTVTVRVRPSGHEFHAEPQETILEAALRAGLAVTYSCSNGSCGECKARLLSGQLGETRPHDYRFSAAEKSRGYFLMCSAGAASALEIETREAGGVADIPEQRIVTRVAKRILLDDYVLSLHLRTPRSQTLRFLAGQHVRLELPGAQPKLASIASCPCNAMHLEFHIPRIPGDAAGEYAFTRLSNNEALTIQGPYGHFTLCDDGTRPLILLAYEAGFAAMKSVIEHAIALEYTYPIHLYWVVRNAGGHYMENYCRSWADALDDFRYTPVIGAETLPAQDGFILPEQDILQGAERIVADYPDLSGQEVYVNGPESLVTSTRELFMRHGLPTGHLHIDAV